MLTRSGTETIFYELRFLYFRPDLTSGESIIVGVIARGEDQEKILHTHFYRDLYGERVAQAWPTMDQQAFCNMLQEIYRKYQAIGPEYFRLVDLCNAVILPGNMNWTWGEPRFGVTDDLEQRVDMVYSEYVMKNLKRNV